MPSPLLRDLALDAVEGRVAGGSPPNTVEAYRNDLVSFVEHAEGLGAGEVARLTHAVVAAYLTKTQLDWSEATHARRRSHLRTFLAGVVAAGLADPAVVPPPSGPRPAPAVRTTIGATALDRILTALGYRSRRRLVRRDRAILMLLVSAGLRATELVELRSIDYHHESGTLMLARGPVLLSEEARAALDDHLSHLPFEPDGAERIFLSGHGRAMSRQGLWVVVERLVAEAGLPRLNARQLRYARAVELVRSGAKGREVAQALGVTLAHGEATARSLRRARLVEVA